VPGQHVERLHLVAELDPGQLDAAQFIAGSSPYDDVVDRCGSVTSCAQQIDMNRPIGMHLDEVGDVRKRQLFEFE
jgi:hypothetical protein